MTETACSGAVRQSTSTTVLPGRIVDGIGGGAGGAAAGISGGDGGDGNGGGGGGGGGGDADVANWVDGGDTIGRPLCRSAATSAGDATPISGNLLVYFKPSFLSKVELGLEERGAAMVGNQHRMACRL